MTGADTATFKVYRRKTLIPSQRWGWRLRHQNGRNLAVSGEGYANRSMCERQGLEVITGAYAPG